MVSIRAAGVDGDIGAGHASQKGGQVRVGDEIVVINQGGRATRIRLRFAYPAPDHIRHRKAFWRRFAAQVHHQEIRHRLGVILADEAATKRTRSSGRLFTFPTHHNRLRDY